MNLIEWTSIFEICNKINSIERVLRKNGVLGGTPDQILTGSFSILG